MLYGWVGSKSWYRGKGCLYSVLPNRGRLSKANVWQQAIELTNRVFKVTAGLDLPSGNHWLAVVTVCLDQANEKLDSIRILLDKGYNDSAIVLIRSFFELVVNLAYLSKDTGKRLSQYLSHGGVPLTDEDVQQLQQKLVRGNAQDVFDSIPRKSWKTLYEMCFDLGSGWLGEYETFYRYASVPTHSGSFTLGTNFKRLLEQKSPSGYKKAAILINALDFHLRVVGITAQVFPEQIDSKTVNGLKSDCQRLEQFIVQCIKKDVGQRYLNTRSTRNP